MKTTTTHRHRWPAAAPLLAGALALAAAATLPAGCARTVIAERLDTTYPAGDLDGEMSFWHSLPGRSAVSNEEGLHGIVLLADGEDRSRSYDERIAYMKQRGWLPDHWDEPPDLAIQRGILARALVQILDVEGGVWLRLLGPTSRYGMRELVYRGIMPPGTEHQTISGLDYIGVITKCQDELTARRAAAQSPPGADAVPGAPAGT